MFCTYTRPRYQVSVFRTNGPLVRERERERERERADVCAVDFLFFF